MPPTQLKLYVNLDGILEFLTGTMSSVHSAVVSVLWFPWIPL